MVQLYLSDPIASVTRPVKQLKGFKRVEIEPGETAKVSFHLDVRHLAFYDRDMNYIVESGAIEVNIGAASDDIRLTTDFTITETKTVKAVYETPVTVSKLA